MSLPASFIECMQFPVNAAFLKKKKNIGLSLHADICFLENSREWETMCDVIHTTKQYWWKTHAYSHKMG